MGYVENNLLPGEYVQHYGKTTFLYVLPSILGVLLFFILGLLSESFSEMFYDNWSITIPSSYFQLFFYTITGVFFIMYIVRMITYMTSEIVITNRRIVAKRGFISINVSDIDLDKCVGVSFHQSFWGRLFGFGSVEVSSSGRKSQRFKALARPYDFRNLVFCAIDERQLEMK